VRYELIGRGLRALRHRGGLRQQDVADRADLSRAVVSDLEHGRIERHSVAALVSAAHALGATLRIDLGLPGGDLHRLLDADHAWLQAEWAGLLERYGWIAEAERTFNHYGERGSVDLLAWHSPSRVLLVVEIKTVIVDVQDLLASIDRKVRIGEILARQHGWTVSSVVPALIVAEGSTSRRRLQAHAALFRRFGLRGRSAVAWLRVPAPGAAPTGILCMTKLSRAHPGDRRRAGRQRIRLRTRVPRSESDARRV